MARLRLTIVAALVTCACAQAQQAAPQAPAPAAAAQNPSPMVENTRAHRRVPQLELKGQRWSLSTGTLFLPAGARVRATMPLYVHFHGAPWLPEWSVYQRDHHAAVLTVNIGSGSGVYSKAFADPGTFASLLDEAARTFSAQNPPRFQPVTITSFSAGYGAVREILRNRDNWARIDAILLIDGLHTGYTTGDKPGVEPDLMQPFVDFAREAMAGHKRMMITHSEIFPGTFSSTTETADYLLAQLNLKRTPLVRWGPVGMQQLSEVRAGRFHLLGFAGNSAPDHVDQFHGMKDWLKYLR